MATRLRGWLEAAARWRTPPPRWRGVILLAAATIFVGGVVLSLRELDVAIEDVTWWPLVVIAVLGTPATVLANAAELRAMARAIDPDLSVSWRRAVQVVVVATAANVLPLPGGALVRIHALKVAGMTVPRATAVNLVAAVLWVGAAVSLAGLAALAYAPAAGGLALALGLAGVVVGLAGLRSLARRPAWGGAGALLGVEVATTLLHAVRLLLVLIALDVEVVAAQALVLGAAAPLAAAAGIFPSGLGLAELLSALLAPAVALSAASGFAATALVRVIGLAAIAPMALLLGLGELRRVGEAAEADLPADQTIDPSTGP